MKFDEIKIGKTYYTCSSEYSGTKNFVTKNYRPYFVLGLDAKARKVFASCGGLPPRFYRNISHWVDKLPDNAGIKINRLIPSISDPLTDSKTD